MLSNKKYVHVLRCRRESDTYSKSRDNNLPMRLMETRCLLLVLCQPGGEMALLASLSWRFDCESALMSADAD